MQAVAQRGDRIGVNYGPPPSLLPARPHHTSSAATQGPETRAPDAATAGGFQWWGRRTDVRRAPVAGHRPGRGPEEGARPLGRREMARGWRGARGQPRHSQPERPLARHTWARTSWDHPAARVLVLPPTGTPGNPGGLARRPQPAPHSHPGAGHSLRWLPLHNRAGGGTAPPRTRPRSSPLGAGPGLRRVRLGTRACVTEGCSPTIRVRTGRRPRSQRPSSAKSRLP